MLLSFPAYNRFFALLLVINVITGQMTGLFLTEFFLHELVIDMVNNQERWYH